MGSQTSRFGCGILNGGGSKGEGYLRHFGEPRQALGNAREHRAVLSYLPPPGPPSLKDSIIQGLQRLYPMQRALPLLVKLLPA